MKKLLTIILTLILSLSLTACGSSDDKKDSSNNSTTPNNAANTNDDKDANNDNSDNSEGELYLGKYPTDINEWTAQNLVDYFNEKVDFPSNCETWVQDHETYYAGMPVYEASGVWDDAEMVTLMFFVFNPDSPDTTPEEVAKVKAAFKDTEDHMYIDEGEGIYIGPADHLMGNVAITYMYTIDEDVYNAIDEAFNQLVEDLNITLDF